MERNDSTFSCILKVLTKEETCHQKEMTSVNESKTENMSTLKEEKNNRSQTASWEAWWPTCWRNARSCRMKTRGVNNMMISSNQSVSVKGRKDDYPKWWSPTAGSNMVGLSRICALTLLARHFPAWRTVGYLSADPTNEELEACLMYRQRKLSE